MPFFTLDEVRLMMNDPSLIRNVSIIGEIDHGRSTLSDVLIAKAGIILSQKTTCMRYDKEDFHKPLFRWPPAIILHYPHDPDKIGIQKDYLINFIESSRHPDLFSEAASTLNIVDGVVLVVDIIQGIGLQTEMLLRKTASERVKPILMINKLDRCILELQQDPEETYQACKKVIDSVNIVLSSYENPEVGDILIDPCKGNVAFGSASRQWAFTIHRFASMYYKKFGLTEETLVNKLWGDNYFDLEEKKWTTENTSKSGKPLKRGFVQFILEPIIKITRFVMDGNKEQVDRILPKIDVVLTSEEKEYVGKHLLKVILMKWINAGDCLLEMIVVHLPSPQAAQKYRVSHLYDGPQDDICAQAIRECNPKGPLMFYVSKILNTRMNNCYAFGRVFSGNIRESQEVRIMGPAYRSGRDDDLSIVKLKNLMFSFGRHAERTIDAPCGMTVCLGEIDNFLARNLTISDHIDACRIRPIKYPLCPQIQMIVEPKDPKDLPSLIDGLQNLTKIDSHVTVTQEQTGQHIIGIADKAHLDRCMNDLRTRDITFDLIHYDPLVPFRETIIGVSQLCMANSQNRCNRIYCTAQPLTQEFSKFLESEDIRPDKDIIERASRFEQDFQWNLNDTKQIWSLGAGPNVLVDLSEGAEFMQNIKNSCFEGFGAFVEEGALCGLKVKNMRINIVNAIISSDPAYRPDRGIFSMTKRVYEGCEISAQPRLSEAFYLAEIKACIEDLNNVYKCLTRKGAIVIDEQILTDTSLVLLRSHIPIIEAFGLEAELQSIASSKVVCCCDFSHWAEVDGDPLDKGSLAFDIVRSIRQRKGLNPNQLLLENYIDNV